MTLPRLPEGFSWIPIEEVRKRSREWAGESRADWFSPGAMRFFATRLAKRHAALGKDGRAWFITSEQFRSPRGNGPRLYSLRCQEPDGQVETIGEFQAHRDLRSALRALLAEIQPENT